IPGGNFRDSPRALAGTGKASCSATARAGRSASGDVRGSRSRVGIFFRRGGDEGKIGSRAGFSRQGAGPAGRAVTRPFSFSSSFSRSGGQNEVPKSAGAPGSRKVSKKTSPPPRG